MSEFEQRIEDANFHTELLRIKATADGDHISAAIFRGIIAGREDALNVYRGIEAAKKQRRERRRTIAVA